MHINKQYYSRKMKIKQIIFLGVLVFITNIAYSQHYYKSYNLDSIYTFQSQSESNKVILLEKGVVEYIYEDNNLTQYDLKHIVAFINSSEEVENNNVKYIPYNGTSEIIDARARVIKPDNQIIELDKSKILESYDEETGYKYKYFALEGLDVGSIIEYYYVLKKNPYYYGTKKIIQEEYPILEYQFDLLAPKNLYFEFNLKNDTSKIITDINNEEKNNWTINLHNVPPLIDEEESPYNLLLKQFIYKLDRNTSRNLKDISSYGKASQNVYNNIYNSLDKADNKSLNKFIKQIKIVDLTNIEESIYEIESYIKSNIHIVDYDSEELSKISSLIETKVASSYGITKLITNVLNSFNIKHQIVLTSDRTIIDFDKDFESFNYLEKYLIYFPETKNYMAPDEFEYRYGLVPPQYTNNYGLFIKQISIGELNTGMGKVKFIEPYDYDKTHHNLIIKGAINKDFSQVDLNIKQSSLGYYAAPIQPYLDLLSEDIKKDLLDETMENFIPNSTINNTKVVNGSASVVNKEPLVLDFDISNTDLIDLAGNKFLFKVGSLIGPQVELYSENKRNLPVYDNYKRTFDREIEIEIPEGYQIKNLNDLKINEEFVRDGETILIFSSDYIINSNVLKINIEEYYDQIYFDVNEYADYRRVVNSASDFSKTILIIEKN